MTDSTQALDLEGLEAKAEALREAEEERDECGYDWSYDRAAEAKGELGFALMEGARVLIAAARERDALSHENARLRAALNRIAAPRHEVIYCRDGHEEAVLTARAVLNKIGGADHG